jgi:hypothetical protein
MDDLVSLLIFLGVFIFSLLAGGKKRKAQQQRPPTRARPPTAAGPRERQVPATERLTSRPEALATERPASRPVGATPRGDQGTASNEPKDMVEGLLDLLRGRIPIEMPPKPVEQPEILVDDEAQSLEELRPDREREHREFHEKYVALSTPARVTSRPRSRYRLTPKTAREAVVWTAIFTKPKGLE